MNRMQRRAAEQTKQAFVAKMQMGKRMKRLVVKRPPVLPTAEALALVRRWQVNHNRVGV